MSVYDGEGEERTEHSSTWRDVPLLQGCQPSCPSPQYCDARREGDERNSHSAVVHMAHHISLALQGSAETVGNAGPKCAIS